MLSSRLGIMNIAVTLFIYKLHQEAWIIHRASFTARSSKKKKTSTTTNKNDNTLEMTIKKETKLQKQNWGGH